MGSRNFLSELSFERFDFLFLFSENLIDDIEFASDVLPEIITTEFDVVRFTVLPKLTKMGTQSYDWTDEPIAESNGVEHKGREDRDENDSQVYEFAKFIA